MPQPRIRLARLGVVANGLWSAELWADRVGVVAEDREGDCCCVNGVRLNRWTRGRGMNYMALSSLSCHAYGPFPHLIIVVRRYAKFSRICLLEICFASIAPRVLGNRRQRCCIDALRILGTHQVPGVFRPGASISAIGWGAASELGVVHLRVYIINERNEVIESAWEQAWNVWNNGTLIAKGTATMVTTEKTEKPACGHP